MANKSNFYVYIGPSITGVILHGKIYHGTRAKALQAAKLAIERQPLVKHLIVSSADLPTARLKVKTPGNALYKYSEQIKKGG